MDCIFQILYSTGGYGEIRIKNFQKIISRKIGDITQTIIAFSTEDEFTKEFNRIKNIIDNEYSSHLSLKTGVSCPGIDNCYYTYPYKFAIYQYGGDNSCEIITEDDVLFRKTEEDYENSRKEIIKLSKELGVEDAIKKIFGSNYENL